MHDRGQWIGASRQHPAQLRTPVWRERNERRVATRVAPQNGHWRKRHL